MNEAARNTVIRAFGLALDRTTCAVDDNRRLMRARSSHTFTEVWDSDCQRAAHVKANDPAVSSHREDEARRSGGIDSPA